MVYTTDDEWNQFVGVVSLLEQENILGSNPKDFRITSFHDHHPITKNIWSFNISGGWSVLILSENVRPIARKSDRAWVDMDRNARLTKKDAVQSFPVVLVGDKGNGKFVVYGNYAIFQNGSLEEGNLQLARNLVIWLCCQAVFI